LNADDRLEGPLGRSLDKDLVEALHFPMQAVTIREAKARLNALVDAAERGEQVVLMRGSRLVAAIIPVSAADLEFAAHLTDPQAERLWRQLERERASGASLVFDAPEQAVAQLGSGRRKTARPDPARPKGGRGRRRPG
jgi:prevent-host-death family protein